MMKIAKILVLVGALNWGLAGIGGFIGTNLNIVNLIFGSISWLENIIYILVGLSAVMKIVGCRCKMCKGGAACVTCGTSCGGACENKSSTPGAVNM